MYCPECRKKCKELQQAGAIWYYHCTRCEVYYGYNGYVEPPSYECYGSEYPLGERK